MATLDPNGVLLYQDTDNYTPVHTALNLAQSNLSSLLGANPRFKRVTNITGRLALVTSIGAINITPANPLLVWRADATAGSQLEYTTDGVTWGTYVSKAYLDSQDTGWVDIVLYPNFTSDGAKPQVCRIGEVLYFRGQIIWGGASPEAPFPAGVSNMGYIPASIPVSLSATNSGRTITGETPTNFPGPLSAWISGTEIQIYQPAATHSRALLSGLSGLQVN